PAIERLADALDAKASAFHEIIKIGRTHLQDATPIRLGQEFGGYAAQMRIGAERLHGALGGLCELALGGTAAGTGINTHPECGARVAAELARATGAPFKEARNHFEAQHAKDAVVDASARIRTVAIAFSKIANDIRLMGCGPRCG